MNDSQGFRRRARPARRIVSIAFQTMVRALRHRNFQLFFSGQLISLIGTWMQNVAQAWLVYRLTGSAFLLGVVGFAGQIPVFIFAPVGGMVADRRNRQRVVIATQTSSMILAFILAALTLLRVVTVVGNHRARRVAGRRERLRHSRAASLPRSTWWAATI